MKLNFNLIKVFVVGGFLGGVLTLLPTVSQAQQTRMPVLEQLDLTPDQETQMAEVRRDTLAQLETIVSAEQRETFKSKMTEGATLREAIASMNLSEDQRTQVRATFQAARQEAQTILTPAQQEEVRELLQSRLRPQ
jgi:periplasmic protein CpxP/Spy